MWLMRSKNVFGAAALALVLGACMNLKMYEGADAGYLVASLAMGTDSTYGNVQFDFRNRDGSVDSYLFWVNDAAVLGPVADFHSANGKGGIATVRLKPGQYEFYSFGVKSSDLDYAPRAAYSVPFTIEGGKTTYVGEFLTLGLPRKGLFGNEISGAPYFVVSNQQARDIALASAKAPELARFPVIAAVPDPTSLHVPYFQPAPLPRGQATP